MAAWLVWCCRGCTRVWPNDRSLAVGLEELTEFRHNCVGKCADARSPPLRSLAKKSSRQKSWWFFRHRPGTANWSALGASKSSSVEPSRSYCAVITDAPTHQVHLGPGFRVADHRRRVVLKHAGYRLQVADVGVDDAVEGATALYNSLRTGRSVALPTLSTADIHRPYSKVTQSRSETRAMLLLIMKADCYHDKWPRQVHHRNYDRPSDGLGAKALLHSTFAAWACTTAKRALRSHQIPTTEHNSEKVSSSTRPMWTPLQDGRADNKERQMPISKRHLPSLSRSVIFHRKNGQG